VLTDILVDHWTVQIFDLLSFDINTGFNVLDPQLINDTLEGLVPLAARPRYDFVTGSFGSSGTVYVAQVKGFDVAGNIKIMGRSPAVRCP
jgi:hypothetical protein